MGPLILDRNRRRPKQVPAASRRAGRVDALAKPGDCAGMSEHFVVHFTETEGAIRVRGQRCRSLPHRDYVDAAVRWRT